MTQPVSSTAVHHGLMPTATLPWWATSGVGLPQCQHGPPGHVGQGVRERRPGGRRPGRASSGSRAPAGRPVERPSFRTVRGVTPARASEVRDRSLTSAGTATAPQESRRSRSGRCHHGDGRTSLHPHVKVGLLRSPVLRSTPAACRSTSNPRAFWAGFPSLAGLTSRADDQRRDWPSDDVEVMPGGYEWDCDRTPSNPASPPPATRRPPERTSRRAAPASRAALKLTVPLPPVHLCVCAFIPASLACRAVVTPPAMSLRSFRPPGPPSEAGHAPEAHHAG